jgi:LmbE family N-acetylglucosaminyl deacetylase
MEYSGDVFCPYERSFQTALSMTTEVGIAAHPDDLELSMFPGITACFRDEDRWFTGIVCTNGIGCPILPRYAEFSKSDFIRLRWQEQCHAANYGNYAAVIGLKAEDSPYFRGETVVDQITGYLELARPETVYTHDPADGHPHHIQVCQAVVDAVRRLPEAIRPKYVYGCEGWRSMDWIPPDLRACFDVSGHEELGASLIQVYATQDAGLLEGFVLRRRVNAAIVSQVTGVPLTSVINAVDLRPLIRDEKQDVLTFTAGLVGRFYASVAKLAHESQEYWETLLSRPENPLFPFDFKTLERQPL